MHTPNSCEAGASLSITHFQNVLAELGQNQAQFLENLWEGVSYGIFILDVLAQGQDFRFVAFNRVVAQTGLLPVDLLQGKTVRESMSPAIADIYCRHYSNCVQTGQAVTFEECFEHEGQKTSWLLTVSPIIQNQQVVQLIVSTVDITEKAQLVQRQEQIQKEQIQSPRVSSEARYCGLDEAAQEIIGCWQLDGTITYLTPAFTANFGFEVDEILGTSFAPLAHPDDVDRCLKANQIAAQTKQKVTGIEFRQRHAEGHWVWVEMSITPILNESGEVVSFQGVMRNIQQQHMLRTAMQFLLEETAAKTGVEFARAFARGIAQSLDAQYGFVTELVDEAGTKSRMLALWTGTEFVDPYEFDLAGTPCEQVFLKQSGVFRNEICRRFPNASALATLAAESYLGVIIRDTQGRAIGNLGIIDTKPLGGEVEQIQAILQLFATRVGAEMQRQKAETALSDYANQLEAALGDLKLAQAQIVQNEKMSSLGQLVAGIAHKINNPVNFIHGNLIHVGNYTQDLLELIQTYQRAYPQPPIDIIEKIEEIDLPYLCEDLPQSVNSMKVGTERIREIVKSLRLFSRLDEAELKLVNIHEGIDSTLMILHNRLKGTLEHGGIQIVKEYGDVPLVECFAGQLNQVFMNILANAIDAIEERQQMALKHQQVIAPGEIRIQTEMRGDQLLISIHDNGGGIPDEVQPKIFDPFFTTKAVGKGTGMGMGISYQIITEKHGGQLTFKSTPGVGTVFTIQLPIRSG